MSHYSELQMTVGIMASIVLGFGIGISIGWTLGFETGETSGLKRAAKMIEDTLHANRRPPS